MEAWKIYFWYFKKHQFVCLYLFCIWAMALVTICLTIVHIGEKTGELESWRGQTGNDRRFKENVNVKVCQIPEKSYWERVIKVQLSWTMKINWECWSIILFKQIGKEWLKIEMLCKRWKY